MGVHACDLVQVSFGLYVAEAGPGLFCLHSVEITGLCHCAAPPAFSELNRPPLSELKLVQGLLDSILESFEGKSFLPLGACLLFCPPLQPSQIGSFKVELMQRENKAKFLPYDTTPIIGGHSLMLTQQPCLMSLVMTVLFHL